MKRGASNISSSSAGDKHKDKDSEEEEVDEAELFGAAMKKVDMKKLMSEEGPVVKCVMLRASGAMEELEVNMSPKLQETQTLLGGGATFLGQWEELEVILMVSM
jgi:hypothetical protein